MKLIRSKGVGVFFCTQLPTDIPNDVLSQLGARVQHALRAFTPEDQAALAKTVRTYPNTKNYDMEEALTSLGTGEAIVTVLSERGAPTPGRVDPDARAALADGRHRRRRRHRGGARRRRCTGSTAQTVDRESAYEKLTAKIAEPPPGAPGPGRGAAPRPAAAPGAGGAGHGRERAGLAGGEVVPALGGQRAGSRDHPRAVRHPAPLPAAASAGRSGRARPRRRDGSTQVSGPTASGSTAAISATASAGATSSTSKRRHRPP